jgi:ribosomal protein S18 acetylase RimI-like enzyme
MWIAQAARGPGVARRLLGEVERTAREAGAVVLRLETNRALSEAIALYKRSGYAEVKAFNSEPSATIGPKKRLGRKGTLGECNNRD